MQHQSLKINDEHLDDKQVAARENCANSSEGATSSTASFLTTWRLPASSTKPKLHQSSEELKNFWREGTECECRVSMVYTHARHAQPSLRVRLKGRRCGGRLRRTQSNSKSIAACR